MRKWLVLMMMWALSACSAGTNNTSFVGTDITGAEFGKPLSLTDHTGKLRNMADFSGKVVVLFFGQRLQGRHGIAWNDGNLLFLGNGCLQQL